MTTVSPHLLLHWFLSSTKFTHTTMIFPSVFPQRHYGLAQNQCLMIYSVQRFQNKWWAQGRMRGITPSVKSMRFLLDKKIKKHLKVTIPTIPIQLYFGLLLLKLIHSRLCLWLYALQLWQPKFVPLFMIVIIDYLKFPTYIHTHTLAWSRSFCNNGGGD